MSKQLNRRQVAAAGLGLVGANALGAEPAAATSGGSAGTLAQDYAIVHHNPDRKQYIEGPGLNRLADGSLIAVIPVVPRNEYQLAGKRPDNSHVHILRSTDGGKSWQEASRLPYYSARAWEHEGSLYLFAFQPGVKIRNDDLLLLRSKDGGRSWSQPVTLFKGHYWNCHTGMVIRGRKAYWVVDDLSAGQGEERTHRVIACDLTGDPLDLTLWRMSNPGSFPGVPQNIGNPRFAKSRSQMLEPNLIDVQGQLRVISTVKFQGQTTAGLCAVFDVEDRGGAELKMNFVQYHPMPGGQLKFCVIWDDVSKMFWATANLVVDGQGRFSWWKNAGGKYRGSSTGGNDRRFLMLMYGVDGLNWLQAGCVAQAKTVAQSFMYAAPAIDGNDLAIVARSSVHAPDNHDADHATFHRVKDFRRLALNLVPDPVG
jgi:hypothetical protein